jgi:gliding motility-associated-like protein
MKIIRNTLILLIAILISDYSSSQTNELVYSENVNVYRIVAVENYNEQIVSVSNTVSVEKPLRLYAPNAFSPDGDGINDVFEIKGQGVEEMELEIYNRWGQMVYRSDNLALAWNGEYKGKEAPLGTYVYQVKAVNVSGDITIAKKGSVVLVR